MSIRTSLLERLSSRAGGRRRAQILLEELSFATGVSIESDENCLVALGLIKLGADPTAVAKEVTWREFEGMCAGILRASGYNVRTNVILRKPRREIDIVAESASLALSVDCKHWSAAPGSASLAGIVEAQVQRTTQYKQEPSLLPRPLPILPMVLTLMDPQVRVMGGVPIVPIILLRDFLSNLSRYDDFAFL